MLQAAAASALQAAAAAAAAAAADIARLQSTRLLPPHSQSCSCIPDIVPVPHRKGWAAGAAGAAGSAGAVWVSSWRPR